jgi:uncharacterized membrane protein
MDPHLTEWLNLAIRWLHVITGVAWIGASFYFNWLENNLNRVQGLRDEIAGDLWAVHGGGFYYLEKYKVAPGEIPEDLHWFKWEAYFTWLSGFALLVVVYYLNAGSYMVDPRVADISPLAAVGIGVGALVGAWVVYDQLSKTKLVDNGPAFAVLGFVLVTAAAYGLCQVFSPRAAYIHVGAMIGTCMAANVFFVIIPGQRAMVEAARAGRAPDPQKGKDGARRSRHNNYMTLPVLFIMVSNHFPSTYGNAWNWAVLAGLTLVSVGVRHYFNVRHKPNKAFWVLPAAAVGMVALAFVTSPWIKPDTSVGARPVSFAEVSGIINNRCIQCHAVNNTDEVFKQAQGGVMLDTPEQIVQHAERIKARAVTTRTMPFLNKTGITDEERQLLGWWVDQGATLD